MKFAIIAALVATASAAVGTDCSKDGYAACEKDVECCGVATPDDGSEATDPITVCQSTDEEEYVNEKNDAETYTFKCNDPAAAPAAKTDDTKKDKGSIRLAAGLATLAVASLM